MNEPKAYGVFSKRKNYVFRDSAYIQWGNSTRSIGSFLLLNPGSSKLSSHLNKELENTGIACGGITLDPTMRQLTLMVCKMYNEQPQLDGRLHIYNLFSLQNPSSEDAIEVFEELTSTGELDINHSMITLEELKEHPWILLGWGCMYKARWINLKQAKLNWLQLIKESGIKSFGKRNGMGDKYYHPCPQLIKDRGAMVDHLVTLYRECT
ncbi:hypothetical protein GA0061096_3699 [Fictibacillus enclensis]|uniref:DUF1643 domain-containing protein n=1 Tax=Fictibacillus enclensis TaxID=1017270 RepID=A0A0V8J4S3_9BACL|nr:hypothetical protein [Fictibacillus enclensis]KSU82085.1 hypothetical protein AS030_17595 [Fictibacillus enclensis]SCC30090.1 hypothetical protein GA0061096_3699 [Fictibacillus enclensis]